MKVTFAVKLVKTKLKTVAANVTNQICHTALEPLKLKKRKCMSNTAKTLLLISKTYF